jgi:hypothetical protein
MICPKSMWLIISLSVALCSLLACALNVQAAPVSSEESVFYPPAVVQQARRNVQTNPWAAEVRKQVLAHAQPWIERSDQQLWELMFGNTIKRAWQVWSNGYCPACKQSVPMYEWQMDALHHPWKVRCPRCGEEFPKNDFSRFYQSGLDESHVFDPARADRTLLYNQAHPDPNDPLHLFGVDDGEGYVADGHRWRFIGAYLIFGQWKQGIVDGIRSLAAAYTLTGDPIYAHKAGVLLDRVADLYPTMDFGKEGVMYEGAPRSGYVSTWHDSCEETREMALAYDQVRAAIGRDNELAVFLAKQARHYHVPNPKTTCADVQHNIEARILHDALQNPDKIYSNYPRTEYTTAVLQTVLDWPGSRAQVFQQLGSVIDKATTIDGVTGEKGLTGYSAFTIQGMAGILSLYERIEPGFLKEMFRLHPQLRKTWRFFIDTWCSQQYYPRVGDTGAFAYRTEQYAGLILNNSSGISGDVFNFSFAPSMVTFLWQLYQNTHDPAYVQVLYHANGGKVDGLPYDLFTSNPARFQQAVSRVIAREGAALKLGSVNKTQWHLAILRSGAGKNERDLWMDYDSGGYHAHADGMNIGLFAYGLDLLPDFGYPPVQFGGWDAPRARWYMMTAAHNTVVVDGKDHRNLAGPITEPAGHEGLPAGQTTLWADGKQFHALRASGATIIEGQQFERTLGMVDLSDRDFYVFDLFRVVGGKDHARFLHSAYGSITTQGLTLQSAPDYGHGAQMRNFQEDASPQAGWSVDWKIEDRLKYLPPQANIHLRLTDLTKGAQAYTAESWVAPNGLADKDGTWIPTVLVRRQASSEPLASAFVSLLDPYDQAPHILQAQRLSLQSPSGSAYPDSNVAIEMRLADGRRDLLLAADAENPQGLQPSLARDHILIQPDWEAHLEGELCLVRRSAKGEITHLVLCRSRSLHVGDITLRLRNAATCDVLTLQRNGKPIPWDHGA